MTQHQSEVDRGERIEFEKNGSSFLRRVNDNRISRAEKSLLDKLELPSLKEKRFLHIGSGGGFFDLAARRLGAGARSFYYDPQSVACTFQLRGRFDPGDPDWIVEPDSELNDSFVRVLLKYDIVYRRRTRLQYVFLKSR